MLAYKASVRAQSLGDARMANVVLLGAVSRELEFTMEDGGVGGGDAGVLPRPRSGA
ncbi:MAG: hypothetical protein N0A24_09635 [Armatimonadetes bacterium]|nr:hypothetical protein [Armatimonadota bacterium]MDW8154440.1 hypothetical protein [Armatimonadota bacterium]